MLRRTTQGRDRSSGQRETASWNLLCCSHVRNPPGAHDPVAPVRRRESLHAHDALAARRVDEFVPANRKTDVRRAVAFGVKEDQIAGMQVAHFDLLAGAEL